MFSEAYEPFVTSGVLCCSVFATLLCGSFLPHASEQSSSIAPFQRGRSMVFGAILEALLLCRMSHGSSNLISVLITG
jgi:hypothetical protein